MPRRAAVPLCAVLLFALVRPVSAQNAAASVLERSPNMIAGWPGEPGTIDFNFLHRFTESGPPEHKVSNSPTFVVAAGVPWATTVGFDYSSNSDVVPRMPNEWEFFGRVVPFRHANRVVDLSIQLGYNEGARSTDGELGLARRFGPLRVLTAARTFSDAYGAGRRRTAFAGGTSVQLTRYLALAGDVGSLRDRGPDERVAWSAGVQLGIPNAPHSLSLQATNVNTATLEGVSRGTPHTRYGFEYTVPITLARYIPALRHAPAAPRADRSSTAAGVANGDTVRAAMRQLAFEPARITVPVGGTVVWSNDAPLAHSVTADDGSFDSGLIDAGKRWAHTFSRPGTYAFHCTPHPFMKGVVVVR